MKKIIAILIILVLGIFVLEGCSRTVPDSRDNNVNPNEPAKQQPQKTSDNIPSPPALPEE
jgi:hypothetical protein